MESGGLGVGGLGREGREAGVPFGVRGGRVAAVCTGGSTATLAAV